MPEPGERMPDHVRVRCACSHMARPTCFGDLVEIAPRHLQVDIELSENVAREVSAGACALIQLFQFVDLQQPIEGRHDRARQARRGD